ncbi:alpha/beta hydrolase family protein [Crocinitomix catalasitica]|uniref:alpha/beta hydrolase family protein n=1 Tax=Crocinitomix catalasitica TaxID=184607 RepID=UPI00056B6949|nr:alpha/beta hydrolase [Crocinitomix catalasitica]
MLIEFKNKIFIGSDNRKSLFDCRIPKDAKAMIIFVHGYKGFKDWGAWNLMENYFVDKGVGFVKFNMSHNGGTVDNPIDFDDLEAFGNNRYSYELNDLNIIIAETKRMVEQECELEIPIFLLGHSRGGGIVILGGDNHPDIEGIISLAGISNIENRFPTDEALEEWKETGYYTVFNGRTHQEMPHYYSFYEDFIQHKGGLDIEKTASGLKKKFLQIHGDMDLAVSISEGLLLARWTETEIEIIKGADHVFGSSHPWITKELPYDLKLALEKIFKFIT